MLCKEITLSDFRNVEEATLSFCDGVNVLYGGNAEGKTNIIEAVFLFAHGRGFRARSDASMIRLGQKHMKLKMQFEGDGRTQVMEFELHPGKESGTLNRVCRCNGVVIRRLSEFVGRFRAVLFCPDHLSLVKDGPAARRAFLDAALSQMYPAYLASLQRYHAILRQRNALLRSQLMRSGSIDGAFSANLEVWSRQLAKEAACIAKHRILYTESMGKKASELLSEMSSGRETLCFRYPEMCEEEDFIRLWTENTEQELRMESTLHGIHHDDCSVILNGRDARQFCSQGQQRSIALVMKLAEGEQILKETGEYPVFLLDDILSELDADRRRFVTDGFEGKQILIASCEAVNGGERRFYVKGGTYLCEKNGE